MKIGLISDLHMDRNNQRMQEEYDYAGMLAEIVTRRQVDLVLVAGDVSNDYQLSHNFLQALQDQAGKPAYFVPGNHEFWQEEGSSTKAPDILDFFMQQEENLVGQPRLLTDNYALVGSPGWYDYGYGDNERFSVGDFARGQYRFARWNDHQFVDWGVSDQKVASEMKIQLEKDLQQVADKKIILMTHVANHPRFVVPLPNKLYDYVNAFLGAQTYESLYQDYPVHYNVMGHVHWRLHLRERSVHHMMACLGHRKQWLNRWDPMAELDNTLLTFTIP